MSTQKSREQNRWVVPAWMEPFRRLVVNTGGNSVEELMNGNADPFINLPLSTIQACVKSQVALLNGLHGRGLLGEQTTTRTAKANNYGHRR